MTTPTERADRALATLDPSGEVMRDLRAGTSADARIADMLWFLASLSGLTASDPQFYEAVFPNDTPYNQRDFATKETCGTVCEAGLRRAGVRDPWLEMPYADSITGGRPPAVVCQRQIAQKNGAWVASDGENSPNVGDMVQVDNAVHVLTTFALLADATGERGTLTSIDGGQTPVEIQVSPRSRPWVWGVNGPSYTEGNRKVTGWIDMRKLLQSSTPNA